MRLRNSCPIAVVVVMLLVATVATSEEPNKKPWRAAFDPEGVSTEGTPLPDSIDATYFQESFDGALFPPAGWTEVIVNDPGTDPDWSQVASGTYPTIAPYSGPAMAKFNSYNCPNLASARLSTPVLDMTSVVGPSLHFWMSHDTGYTTNADRITVQISTDGGTTWPVDAGTFNRYDATCTTPCWREHIVDLTPFVGLSTVSVGFLGVSTYGNNFYLDLVSVRVSGPDLTTSTKTAPSTVAVGDEMTYTVQVVNSGDMAATGATMVDVLPGGTTYVPSSVGCDLGMCSYNVGLNQVEWAYDLPAGTTATITFDVDTDAVACGTITNTATIDSVGLIGGAVNRAVETTAVATLPVLTEGFEDVTFPPVGWGQEALPPNTTNLWNRVTAGTNPTIAPHGGGAMAQWNSYNFSTAGNATRLYTPDVDLYGLTSPYLRFWMSHDSAYPEYDDRVQVQASTDGGMSWDDLGGPISRYDAGCGAGCWQRHAVDLSAYIGMSGVRLGLVAITEFGNNIFVDDVSVGDPWYPCPHVLLDPDYAVAGCNGDIFNYPLTVENNFTATDTLDITGTATWPTTVDPASFTLSPGQADDAIASVYINWAVPRGESDVASLLVTGQTSGLTDPAAISTFNYLAATYTDYADVPTAPTGLRTRDHSVVYYNGRLYKFGGTDGTVRNLTGVYDIATNTWSTADNMPAARQMLDCVEIGGKIYCAGGYTTSSQNTLYIFDPAAAAGSQWTTGATLPASRSGYAGVALGGKYYVLGGYTTAITATCIVYDPVANSWSNLPNMEVPRRYPLAGVIGGKIVVAGGLATTISTPSTQAYDPMTNTWSPRAPIPFGGWLRSADGVLDDRFLLIVGGYTADSTASTYVIAYDGLLDVWMPPQVFSPHSIYSTEGDTDGAGNFWVVSGRLYEGAAFSYGRYTYTATGCPSCAPAFNPDFTADPPVAAPGQEITFTASSEGSAPFEFSWDFGDMSSATGQVVSHSYPLDGTFTVTLTVTNCDGASTAGITHDIEVTPVADLSVFKTDGVTQVAPGDPVTYDITVSNAGPSDVTGARVIDFFPADLLGVTWTCAPSGTGTCTPSGAGNIDDMAGIPSGESVVYTATATVDTDAEGVLIDGRSSLVNTANVYPAAGVGDPDLTNNSSTDIDDIGLVADIGIVKDDGVTEVTAGSPVTYAITVLNAGPNDVAAAIVTDAFPASITGVTWTCVGSGGGVCAPAGAGNLVDIANLPFGGAVVYTATGTVSPAATGTIDNTATVTVTGATDPNLANNSSTDSDTVIAEVDLAISKTDHACYVLPGGSTTYTITATNSGPASAVGATVIDTFPADVTTVSWTCAASGGAVCTASGSGNINDTVTVPAGGMLVYTATATVDAMATGYLVNTATVDPAMGVFDTDLTNNESTDTNALELPVFCDGFESGTTGAWSSVLP